MCNLSEDMVPTDAFFQVETSHKQFLLIVGLMPHHDDNTLLLLDYQNISRESDGFQWLFGQQAVNA